MDENKLGANSGRKRSIFSIDIVNRIYSWIERPCQNRYTHFLSGCRKARTDSRPATSFLERAASSPAWPQERNSIIHKLLPHDQHDLVIHAKVAKRIRVRLDRAVPTHLRLSKSELFWPRVCFFQTPFLQGSRCAGQHGIIEKIHRESKHPSQLSEKKLDEKSDKCRPHNQLILPG